jgi:hypothetical protein
MTGTLLSRRRGLFECSDAFVEWWMRHKQALEATTRPVIITEGSKLVGVSIALAPVGRLAIHFDTANYNERSSKTEYRRKQQQTVDVEPYALLMQKSLKP